MRTGSDPHSVTPGYAVLPPVERGERGSLRGEVPMQAGNRRSSRARRCRGPVSGGGRGLWVLVAVLGQAQAVRSSQLKAGCVAVAQRLRRRRATGSGHRWWFSYPRPGWGRAQAGVLVGRAAPASAGPRAARSGGLTSVRLRCLPRLGLDASLTPLRSILTASIRLPAAPGCEAEGMRVQSSQGLPARRQRLGAAIGLLGLPC